MDYLEKYKYWCTCPCFRKEVKKKLADLKDEEIQELFGTELTFGTGGIRGLMGLGTSRMNIYTVMKITKGLGEYLRQGEPGVKTVVIGYDCRHNSFEFAKTAAFVLNDMGIKTYLFSEPCPTPLLSFGVKNLKASAGIMITASHNPPEYNGYKIYGNNGVQVISPCDREIMAYINENRDYELLVRMVEGKTTEAPLFNYVPEEVETYYFQELESLSFPLDKKVKEDLKLVYSPLHGVNGKITAKVFSKFGFKNVVYVEEQMNPDGNFPTLAIPNPEKEEAYVLALKTGAKQGGDLILISDPDGDRLGVAVKNDEGGFVILNGNEVGVLLLQYLLEQQGTTKLKGEIITTVVSTRLADKIGAKYKIPITRCLTGFKYIGEKMANSQKKEEPQFLFGFEESCGYLYGTYAGDKDGIAAAMLMAEAAACYRSKGRSLFSVLSDIYKKFGYYKSKVYYFDLTAPATEIMKHLRKNAVDTIGPLPVWGRRDYLTSEYCNFITAECLPLKLPRADVLYYELFNEGWLCFRPSGTEPKIKVYVEVKGKNLTDCNRKLRQIDIILKKILEKTGKAV